MGFCFTSLFLKIVMYLFQLVHSARCILTDVKRMQVGFRSLRNLLHLGFIPLCVTTDGLDIYHVIHVLIPEWFLTLGKTRTQTIKTQST